jgi:hypothetical protein
MNAQSAVQSPVPPIDRRAVVVRHDVVIDKPDPLTPLSVGNGKFVFTADITGLQTFPRLYQTGMPLGTHAQWGWHSFPNPADYQLEDALEPCIVAGREVPYASGIAAGASGFGGYSPASHWLRANPHRLHLGQIGLRLSKADGSPAQLEDLAHTRQRLDLWNGQIDSRLRTLARALGKAQAYGVIESARMLLPRV